MWFYVFQSGTKLTPSRNNTLVLTDSLGRMFDLKHATTKWYPGATITSLRDELPFIGLRRYKCLLLLVGTNDLTPKMCWIDFKNNKKKGTELPSLNYNHKTPAI